MNSLKVNPTPNRYVPHFEIVWVRADDGKWVAASSIASMLWGSSWKANTNSPDKGECDSEEEAVLNQLIFVRGLRSVQEDKVALRMIQTMEELVKERFKAVSEPIQLDLFA